MELKQRPKTSGSGNVFKNPWLEKLTKTHISAPLILYYAASAVLMIYGLREGYFGSLAAVGLFFGGMLAFTLLEYVMHRFLFHLPPTTPQKEKIAYKLHGVHHDYPKDRDRLAMPIPLSLLFAITFFFLYWAMMGDLVYGFTPGFFSGYATYLTIHYMVHAFPPPRNFFKVLWVHHGIHHYKDPDHAFGVSSPLWDYIFRTMPKK